MRIKKLLTHLPLMAVFAGGLAVASADAAAPANPIPYEDGSWVTITGVVASSDADSFKLAYGQGTIEVEMDDWSWYAKGYAALPGDTATVTGRVDNDAFEARTIEASTVYMHKADAYYYASADDEEYRDGVMTMVPSDQPNVSVEGVIASVDNEAGEFLLHTGYGEIRVDTKLMGYNPLDKVGFQVLEENDRVLVVGDPTREEGVLDLFDRREIMADSIVTLEDDARLGS